MEGAWPNRDFNTGVVFFHQDMTVYLRVGFDPNEHLKMK